ncbi:hypothetical protein [Fusobacterium necrophorum]
MSHSDFIKVLFDLQDPNLYFLEDDIQRIQKNKSTLKYYMLL